MNRRTGRRPGDSGARQAILDAARVSFAANGYDAAMAHTFLSVWDAEGMGVEPLASLPTETLADLIAPTLQRYLVGDLGTSS